MYNIQTYNHISPLGLNHFEGDMFILNPTETKAPHAIMLRSHKLSGEDCPSELLAIARAGAGTNNVPVEHCTQQGTVVFNTPGANANAVKELVITALLLGCRGIAEGMAYVAAMDPSMETSEFHRQVEAQKKAFKGIELKGKTLGVVGLGAIGANVASCCLELGMNVVGYDPAISVDAAWRLPSAVTKMESLESLLKEADFITLHIPALPSTIGLINQERLSHVKPGSVLVNFARSEIVDIESIMHAMESGLISKYISDFPTPELLDHPQVLAMPHLGASTKEAEDNCAVMAAEQMKEFLLKGNIKNSVNFPNTALSVSTGHRMTFCNKNVPGVLGQVMSVLAEQEINVADMINKSHDSIAYSILDVESPINEDVLTKIQSIEAVVKVRYIQTDHTAEFD